MHSAERATRRRALATLLAAGAICLAVPAASEAATFCVFAPPGCSGTTEADIPTALTAAAGTSERDQIILGGGVQSNQQFNDAAGNPVDIVGQGSGPGGTELDLANISLAAKLDEPSSTLQNVAIVGVIGNDVLGLSGTGTGLRVAGSDDAIAVTMRTSSTLRNSIVSQPGSNAVQTTLGSDNVTIQDSDLSGDWAISNAGRFSGRRLRMTGTSRGLDQQNAAVGSLEAGGGSVPVAAVG